MKKHLLPKTTERVSQNTNHVTNSKIRNQTIHNINLQRYSKNNFTQRIDALNYEWDIERTLETNAATIVLASSIAGFMRTKSRCFIVPGLVGLFLLEHALQGWCPPIPILRGMGIRTAQEIQNEKFALKVLRADFYELPSETEHILRIIEKQ